MRRKLYKFRTWRSEYHRRILTHRELWFASPASFNDPFDCGIPLRYDLTSTKGRFGLFAHRRPHSVDNRSARRSKARKLASTSRIDVLSTLELTEKYREFAKKEYGVLSFAGELHYQLLWAHYSDSHQGFCLEFDLDFLETFFDGIVRETNRGNFMSSFEVDYQETYPRIVPNAANLGEQTIKLLCTKAMDWSYEKEWRFIWPKHANFPVHFLPNAVTGIFLGCAMPTTHREVLLSLASKSFSQIPIFEARMSPDKFALDFKAIQLK